MKITRVAVSFERSAGSKKSEVLAYCTIEIDGCAVIHELKIIRRLDRLFVQMPSRKLMDHCPKCCAKNHLKARYCNQCGERLAYKRFSCFDNGRPNLYMDIMHPITPECRDQITVAVLAAYDDACASCAASPV